jgi:hypothetical protein
LAIGIAVALAMMASNVSAIRSAEHIGRNPSPTVNRVPETDFRLGDHQQLRKLFLGN